jgi:two-component system cell cycle sensor histidine kinase/response regulator CckA
MLGYADEAVVRHGVITEDTSFLQKPFTPQALTGTVRDVLDAPHAP